MMFRWRNAWLAILGAMVLLMAQVSNCAAREILFPSEQLTSKASLFEEAPAWNPTYAPPLEIAGQGFVAPISAEFPQVEPAAIPASEPWQWTFLPRGFLYSTYWASEAEPRLATQLFHENGHDELLDSTIGGRIGFVRFGGRNSLEGWQLDLLAGAKLRQDPNEGMDMQSTDFRYDIPLTWRQGQHALKFGYYHISSHAGDEFLLKNPGFTRLNFLRDVFYLGYSYNPIPELRLYSEAGWAFNCDVSEPWEFQFGFDYGPAGPTYIRGAPFIAMNVHLREELDFGGNFAMQAGWAWRGEGLAAGILRTGLYYYNGGSPQFSFYANSEQSIGWGLWYDF